MFLVISFITGGYDHNMSLVSSKFFESMFSFCQRFHSIPQLLLKLHNSTKNHTESCFDNFLVNFFLTVLKILFISGSSTQVSSSFYQKTWCVFCPRSSLEFSCWRELCFLVEIYRFFYSCHTIMLSLFLYSETGKCSQKRLILKVF